MSFEQKIEDLGDACFAIEECLEIFYPLAVDNDEQYLRRELYRIRCSIGTLKRYAQIVDKEIADKTKEK